MGVLGLGLKVLGFILGFRLRGLGSISGFRLWVLGFEGLGLTFSRVDLQVMWGHSLKASGSL